jgi:hypothetical protein
MSFDHFLVLNLCKTASILISRRVSASENSEMVHPILLNNEMVQFSDLVKNLGLLIRRHCQVVSLGASHWPLMLV